MARKQKNNKSNTGRVGAHGHHGDKHPKKRTFLDQFRSNADENGIPHVWKLNYPSEAALFESHPCVHKRMLTMVVEQLEALCWGDGAQDERIRHRERKNLYLGESQNDWNKGQDFDKLEAGKADVMEKVQGFNKYERALRGCQKRAAGVNQFLKKNKRVHAIFLYQTDL